MPITPLRTRTASGLRSMLRGRTLDDDLIREIEKRLIQSDVGVKTTRIRNLSGEQVVMANGDLLASRIRNFKRLQERRIAFRFGVLYDTPPELLEVIPALVREAIDGIDDARFDRAHLHAFGASSLDFEVVYFVTTADYARFMDVQQAINLALLRGFAARGIAFAFETRTVHVASMPGPAVATGQSPA